MESYSDSWRLRSNRMDEPANSSQRHLLMPENALKLSKAGAGDKKKSTASSNDGREENSDAILDRRLTIHCIVEEITSLDDNSWRDYPHNCGTSSKSGRENSKWWHCECRNIEMNSCVVIKASTAMSDLVKNVLQKLGYPSNASSSAMGSILVRNWRALSLNTICPNPKMTVGDVLGELSSLVTLQIQILRPKSAVVQEIKDRLLSFLINKSHTLLSNSGCPLDLLMLTKLCEESAYVRKHMKEESSEEIQQRFDNWLNHVQKSEMFSRGGINGAANNNENRKTSNIFNSKMNHNADACTKLGTGVSNGGAGGNGTSSSVDAESQPSVVSDNEYSKEGESRLGKSTPSGFELPERSDRAVHCTQTKTRMRTSFDPDLELPKLLKWYLENPHPTRQQIHEYVQELNSLESRRGRKKLDMNNVVYWFKNARAAQKRSEYRKFCNIPVPGVKKNCNLLKIPFGKSSSSVLLEDQMPLSDDDASGVTGNVNAFHNEKGKCMQVLGSWNSNGAGEAVLEMQITPPQITHSSPPVKVEEENLTEHEETSTEGMLSIAEESVENVEQSSGDENRAGETNVMEEAQKSFDAGDSSDTEKETKFRKCKEEMRMTAEAEEEEEEEKAGDVCGSKVRNKSLAVDKKFNGFSHSEMSILSRYKSVPQNSILRHSFLYMSQCMNAKLSNLPLSSEERRKRNRTFIDPLTEVPRLEQWFQLSTHPSHSLIVRYTEELNGMPYRKKFPKLETKNVQFWFKNRRAKNKRLNYLDSSNFLSEISRSFPITPSRNRCEGLHGNHGASGARMRPRSASLRSGTSTAEPNLKQPMNCVDHSSSMSTVTSSRDFFPFFKKAGFSQ